MSQDQAKYQAGNQPEAMIEPARTVKALMDGKIVNYDVWGWVKTSAKFRKHIKILRGAKHDIWHYLALGVDENGKCKETIKEICEGTGYSHTEVINTLRELDELGYLSIQKDAKGNIYTPEFVARGERIPTENAVKKVDSTTVESSLVDSVDSTPPIEKPLAIPTELKELKDISSNADKTVDAILEAERNAHEADKQGKAWRGRELVMDAYLPYGDWWHKKTGLHMYAAKAKPKANSSWIKEFQAWWENDLTTEVLELAFQAEVSWRGVITHPRELTAKAIALSVNPNPMSAKNQPPVSNVKRSSVVQYEADGTPITF